VKCHWHHLFLQRAHGKATDAAARSGAERRSDAAMAKTALSQINAAFETMRDGGHAPSAAYYEAQLPKARSIVARLRP